MRCLFCSTFVVALFIFPFNIITGQSSITAAGSSLLSAKAYFQNEIKDNMHLFTGKKYYKYEPGLQGFPFFETNQMQSADIFYDGNLYKNIPLLFDIVRQLAVINQYQQETRIQLLTEKIEYFTLNGHRFENISFDKGGVNSVNKGLFDIVFTGKASVLVKRIKNIKKGFRAEDPYSFSEEDEYFVKKEKGLFNAGNKKAVMLAFDDKKDFVRIFIKKNNLKFKKSIEKDLIMTAAYYSTLN